MKIKRDFITNSSSSSFIVAFPKKIEKLEDVLEFIQQKRKATVVFHDAIQQEPIKYNEKEIKTLAKYLAKYEKYLEFNFDIYYDKNENEILEEFFKNNECLQFIRKYKNCYIYNFSYSDQDGEFGSEMEHGGTFNNLKHLRISHH